MEKAVNRILLAFKAREDRKKEIEPLVTINPPGEPIQKIGRTAKNGYRY